MDSRGMPCARARGAWRVPFEGTQAIVNLQLLTCLRRFQVILKYCRTTQARYFAMTSSREPSREPGERTDDPVRMYLREMGSVELLSREGEIAIAKRIEAGREAMIAGLCESPLTFQAIIIWRDELNDGKVFLRGIIDLEATYAGPGRQGRAGDARRRWPGP